MKIKKTRAKEESENRESESFVSAAQNRLSVLGDSSIPAHHRGIRKVPALIYRVIYGITSYLFFFFLLDTVAKLVATCQASASVVQLSSTDRAVLTL
jgi:hypothetical protein